MVWVQLPRSNFVRTIEGELTPPAARGCRQATVQRRAASRDTFGHSPPLVRQERDVATKRYHNGNNSPDQA